MKPIAQINQPVIGTAGLLTHALAHQVDTYVTDGITILAQASMDAHGAAGLLTHALAHQV
jgi:hypothetical protein